MDKCRHTKLAIDAKDKLCALCPGHYPWHEITALHCGIRGGSQNKVPTLAGKVSIGSGAVAVGRLIPRRD